MSETSRHDRNRQNRRPFVLSFVGEASGGQGARQNRQNRQTAITVMKATPL